MPFAIALLTSALVHVAALLSPGWALPGFEDVDDGRSIDAMLTQTPRQSATPPTRLAATRPVPEISRRTASNVPSSSANTTAPAVPSAPTIEAPVESAVASAPEPTQLSSPEPLPEAAGQKTALPAKGRVRYTVTKGEGGFVIGQTIQEWEHDGRTYRMRAVTETTGLAALFKPVRVIQTSAGEIAEDGLRPREFRHERVKGIDSATMDWGKRVLSYAGKDDALPIGTQDMLSMYYQLVLLRPSTAMHGGLELPIATGRKLERYRFEIAGEEKLQLHVGEHRAVRLRVRSGEDIIELWISSEVPGLPLKIRFIDRHGELFDQIAEEIYIQEVP